MSKSKVNDHVRVKFIHFMEYNSQLIDRRQKPGYIAWICPTAKEYPMIIQNELNYMKSERDSKRVLESVVKLEMDGVVVVGGSWTEFLTEVASFHPAGPRIPQLSESCSLVSWPATKGR